MVDSEQPQLDTKNPYTWQLMLSVLAASLGPAALGADLACSSPTIADINGHPNPFHLNLLQASLGSSIIGLGGFIGIPIFGFLADAFGRRHMLIIVVLPIVVSYLILTAAVKPEMFILGRFLTGFFVGVFDSLPTTYISEISPPEVRGRLVSMAGFFRTIGMMYAFGLGGLVSWNWLLVLCSLISIATAVCFLFVCESPRWLLKQKRKVEATNALQWLRGESHDICVELNDLEKFINESEKVRVSFKTIFQISFFKRLLIIFMLMFLMQFVGATTITLFSVKIFHRYVDDYNSFMLSDIASIFALGGSLFCVLIVDRVGRKPLLIISYAMVTLSLSSLGLYLKYESYVVHLSHFNYIPSACIMLHSFSVRFAVVQVPYILLGELFPLHIRGLVSGICSSLVWLFVFLSSLLFPYADIYLHDFGNYWMMAGVAFCGVIFATLFVPETKGKTLEQIEESYQDSTSTSL